MEYFIYKTQEDKKAIIDEMKKIRKFIYGDDDISCLDRSIKLISYEEAKKDKKLINFINGNLGALCQRGEDCYFRCYGDRSDEIISYFKETIMIHMMLNNSGDTDDISLSIFVPYVYANYISNYLGTNDKPSINDELANFGLIAFSNSYDTYSDNSLIKCALYSRDYLKTMFDRVMGIGSFDKFAELCRTFYESQNMGENTDVKALDKQFMSIIETLKKYFYSRMSEKPDISDDEKKTMADNLGEVYILLVKKYKKEKKTIIKTFTM